MPERVKYNQPTKRPTDKVLFGSLTGVVAYLLTVGAGYIWGVEIPAEIAIAIPVAAAYLVSYAVPESKEVTGE